MSDAPQTTPAHPSRRDRMRTMSPDDLREKFFNRAYVPLILVFLMKFPSEVVWYLDIVAFLATGLSVVWAAQPLEALIWRLKRAEDLIKKSFDG